MYSGLSLKGHSQKRTPSRKDRNFWQEVLHIPVMFLLTKVHLKLERLEREYFTVKPVLKDHSCKSCISKYIKYQYIYTCT